MSEFEKKQGKRKEITRKKIGRKRGKGEERRKNRRKDEGGGVKKEKDQHSQCLSTDFKLRDMCFNH